MPKRVNILALAGMMLLLAGMNVFQGHYPMAGAFVALAVFLAVVHVIRVRRFKRFDQSRTFD